MVTIEYDNNEIKVPTGWDDVKLGTYDKVYHLRPKNARERVDYIAAVCQVEASVLLSWPVEVFNKVVGFMDFLFTDTDVPPSPFVEVGGVRYTVPIDDKITLGMWVDVDEVQKSGEAVLSNVLAIVLRPTGEKYNYENNEARAAMFADLPVSQVLGVMGFFLHCKNVLEAHTAAFSKIQEVADLLPRNISALVSRGGGIKLSQIWRIPKYLILITLLRYQLRKFLPSYSTGRTKTTPKQPSVN